MKLSGVSEMHSYVSGISGRHVGVRLGDAIMTSTSSAQSGTFKIGGDIQINRLDFGAMRITGPGIWASRPIGPKRCER
jgi:hypothetical protein